MRTTTLKRTTKGFTRSIGKRQDGSQPKFLLGHDREAAERRLEAIVELWKVIEARTLPQGSRGSRTYSSGSTSVTLDSFGPWWTAKDEAKAKAIAKGQAVTVSPERESGGDFFARVNGLQELADVTPEPKFGQVFYEAGKNQLMAELVTIKAKLFGEKSKTRDLTGQTLFQAVEAYKKTLLQSADGNGVKDGAKTLWDQLRILPSYLQDCDLGELDFIAVDAAYGTFRGRPTTKAGKRMAKKTCHNMISALNQFFGWLHLHSEWQWRKPGDFSEIKKSVVRLDDDARKAKKKHPLWTIEQLKTIYKYALPLERCWLMLGLNFAYGVDQIGRLTEEEIHWRTTKPSFIDRIRVKKFTQSKHLIWSETAKFLRWAIERRKEIKSKAPELFVKENGFSYWNLTPENNRATEIPAAWYRLLARVRKDHEGFPNYGFNTLRKTSANFISRLKGSSGEIASIHLAHTHTTSDTSLNNYVNKNRKRHFKLLQVLERKLSVIWEGVDGLEEKAKNYIGLEKIEQIRKLRLVDKLPAKEVARICGVSGPTVSRYAAKFRHSKTIARMRKEAAKK